MNIIIEIRSALPCRLKEFNIDGVNADSRWFVIGDTHGNWSIEEREKNDDLNYSCHNWYAEPLSIRKVRNNLPKELQYLTDEEIKDIQDELCEKLHVGNCNWCV